MRYKVTSKRTAFGREDPREFETTKTGYDLLVEATTQTGWKIVDEDEEVLREIAEDYTNSTIDWEFFSRTDSWYFWLVPV